MANKTYKPSSDKKNILVIGGAGFIGSFLCEELVKNDNVICIDNFVTSNVENIRLLIQFPNFEFIKHDITEPIDLEKLPELKKFKVNIHGIQEIYNLACPTVQKDYKKLSIETVLANSSGVKNTLDLAIQYQSRYLFTSTSSVYGDCGNQAVKETTICPLDFLGPRSAYNEGKRFAEMMIKRYAHYYELDTRIARIFSVYGPRMIPKDARLIPDFIDQAINNKTILIEGDKNSKISYIYVQDLVEGLIKLMKYEKNLIINFGSEDEILLEDVAKTIIDLINSKSKIKFVAPPEYISRITRPDISQAKEKLGWFPLVSLEEGLRRTIDYLKASKYLSFQSD